MADLNNNIYYKLELFVDPPETDWEKLCAQVDRQRLEFNKNDSTKHLAQFAQRFLDRYKNGPDTTKEGDPEFPSAFNAGKEGESARDERFKSLNEKIQLDIADGVLEQSEYDDTIKKHKKYFRETAIQARYGSAYPPFKYPTPPKPKSVSDGEKDIVEAVKMKDIVRQLAVCGKGDLYAFLDVNNEGFHQNTSLAEIKKNIAIARSYWSGMGKPTDPNVSAAKKIFDEKYLELCFGSEAQRDGYNLASKKQVFDNFN